MRTWPCFSMYLRKLPGGKTQKESCTGRVKIDPKTASPNDPAKCRRCKNTLPAYVFLNARPIRLIGSDKAWALAVGATRQEHSLKAGNRPAYGASDADAPELHKEGAPPELCIARFCEVPWPAGIDVFRRGTDVDILEVRSRTELWYAMIVRDADPNDRPVVLVVGEGAVLWAIGWMLAGDAKKQESWRDNHGGRPPAWFVPKVALHPMSTLPIAYVLANPWVGRHRAASFQSSDYKHSTYTVDELNRLAWIRAKTVASASVFNALPPEKQAALAAQAVERRLAFIDRLDYELAGDMSLEEDWQLRDFLEVGVPRLQKELVQYEEAAKTEEILLPDLWDFLTEADKQLKLAIEFAERRIATWAVRRAKEAGACV